MNFKKIIFYFILLIGLQFIFIKTVEAAYTDYVPGIGVVTVQHTGVVGGGVHNFSVTDSAGNVHNVTGTINENGRGVPNVSGIVAFGGESIQPPSVRHTTSLDSSARHDEHFTNLVNAGHNLVGYTADGRAYFTNPNGVNTLAPHAAVSIQEAVAIANRLAGNVEVTWERAGEIAARYGAGNQRDLSLSLINQILADTGVTNVTLAGNRRGDFFIRTPSNIAGTPDNNGTPGNGFYFEDFFPRPSARDLSVSQPDYCNTGHSRSFLWTTDSGVVQNSFQIQVDNDSNFSSPVFDTTRINTNVQINHASLNNLSYNTTYHWRLMIWDGMNIDSGWISGPSFTTPIHSYPIVNFISFPRNPVVGETVQFINRTQVSNQTTQSAWSWNFQDGNPLTSNISNPTVVFTSTGSKDIIFKVTDSTGFSCEKREIIHIQPPLPEWREIPPL